MRKVIHPFTEKKLFVYPRDIPDVEQYVNEHYDPNRFTCVDICEGLANIYHNLRPIRVKLLYMNGEIHTGHVVCKVLTPMSSNCALIDPTGDQFLGKTKNMKCAAFNKGDLGYFSDHYLPVKELRNITLIYPDTLEMMEKMPQEYPEARLINI